MSHQLICFQFKLIKYYIKIKFHLLINLSERAVKWLGNALNPVKSCCQICQIQIAHNLFILSHKVNISPFLFCRSK